jgi:hypothetical protein
MLPHDELLHYGRRGMRWGIRNVYAKSAERNAAKAQTSRDKAEVHRLRAKELAESPSKISKRGLKVQNQKLKEYKRTNEARNYQNKADRMKAVSKVGMKPEVRTAKIHEVRNKPYNPREQKQHMSTFNKLLLVGASAAIGAVAGAVVKPSAEIVGHRVAQSVLKTTVKDAATKATVKAVEEDIFGAAARLM